LTYPFTGEFLERLPEPLMKIYRDLEDDIFRYICEQFKTGDANEKAIELIRQLQRGGLPLDEIEKRIKKTLHLSEEEFDRIFKDTIERNRAYYDDTLNRVGLLSSPVRETALKAQEAAIYAQTLWELQNITRSLGFAVPGLGGKVIPGGIQETYTRILDVALVKVQSGATNYNGAIREAIDSLAMSGLQWIDYPTGWHNRIEVSARRAVMTGVGQLCNKYSDALREEIGTEFVEVSAHRGARDKGVGFVCHRDWQGKCYHIGGAVDVDGVHYPDFVSTCGYGDIRGIGGANCRHKYTAFVPGVMERSYTDQELANIDPPPFTFEGKEYSAYEATQMQRKLETAMRAQQRKMDGYEAAGDTEAYTAAKAKYNALSAKYKAFSKAADLPEQRARLYIAKHN
jgi:hypothetical protein